MEAENVDPGPTRTQGEDPEHRLYLNTPAMAVVLSDKWRTQIQALHRTRPDCRDPSAVNARAAGR